MEKWGDAMKNRIADFLPTAGRAGGSGRSPVESFSAGDVARLLEPVEKLVAKYPAAALATAFITGVALAWWIKRK
jgi:hypothetical protein